MLRFRGLVLGAVVIAVGLAAWAVLIRLEQSGKTLRDMEHVEWVDVEQCLRNFYSSDTFAMLKKLPQGNWLEIEDFSSFYLDGTKVWAVIDCSFKTDDGITIIDWKTGRTTTTDVSLQLSCYAMYGKEKWGIKPENIKLIICPGNHDAMRIAEPQPPLYKDFAAAVYELPNVTMVSSPSYVNIHSSDEFPGFEVLLYHGFSFIYYSDAVESIRSAGGQKRPDLIMKFLLQRRHLAPTHTSTLYLPDQEKDNLIIEQVPDIFFTGHIHRAGIYNYRNIQTIAGSCWVAKTEYQEKIGLKPMPCRVPLINLQTRKAKLLRFGDESLD